MTALRARGRMKRRLTPQEKKANVYDRDHVTRGRNSGAAFRKHWRKKETAEQKAHRRKGHTIEKALVLSHDPESEDLEGRVHRRQIRKDRPPSVGELLAEKTARRRRVHNANAAWAAHRQASRDRSIASVLTAMTRKRFVGATSRLRDLPKLAALAGEARGITEEMVRAFLSTHPDWLKALRQWRRANLIDRGLPPRGKDTQRHPG